MLPATCKQMVDLIAKFDIKYSITLPIDYSPTYPAFGLRWDLRRLVNRSLVTISRFDPPLFIKDVEYLKIRLTQRGLKLATSEKK